VEKKGERESEREGVAGKLSTKMFVEPRKVTLSEQLSKIIQ